MFVFQTSLQRKAKAMTATKKTNVNTIQQKEYSNENFGLQFLGCAEYRWDSAVSETSSF